MLGSIRWDAWFNRSKAAPPSYRPLLGADAVEVPSVVPDRPWGCGWFDSSLDLREGLAVIEHAGIDLGLAMACRLVPPDSRH